MIHSLILPPVSKFPSLPQDLQNDEPISGSVRWGGYGLQAPVPPFSAPPLHIAALGTTLLKYEPLVGCFISNPEQ